MRDRSHQSPARAALLGLCIICLGHTVMSATNAASARMLDSKRIVLENPWLRYEVDPAHGGRISSFVDKRDGRERVVPGRLEGMCFDGIYDQDDPLYQGQWGINGAVPYEAQILQSSGNCVRVAVSRASIAYEHGIYNPTYDGLVIEREFVLPTDAPFLKVIIRIHNRSAEGRRPAYFIRNGYMDGPERSHIRYERPSRRGIQDGDPDGDNTDQMVWDPAAGWTATYDTDSGRGVVWLMDASRVMMFYNCISATTARHVEEFPNRHGVDPLWMWDNASATAISAEWYYHRAIIPAGRTWETALYMVPLQGSGPIAHACQEFICSLKLPAKGKAGRLSMSVRPGLRPAHDLTIHAECLSPSQGSRAAPLGACVCRSLADAPVSLRIALRKPLPADAVLRFRVEGKGSDGQPFMRTFDYVGGATPARVTAVLPGPRLSYQYERRVASRVTNAVPRVLFLQGIAFERWGWGEALQQRKAEVRESEFMKRRVATAVRYFPATLDEALQFDLIILGAVDAFSLSYEGVMLMDDYVKSGGSLLVLGGLYSWGNGRFREYGMDAFLPLQVSGTFDLVRGSGARSEIQSDHWKAIGGVPAQSPGGVSWYHQLEAAPDARVLWRSGADPLLAVSDHGAGRIACFAATTLGPEGTEPAPFWKQPAWAPVRDGVVDWLLRR